MEKQRRLKIQIGASVSMFMLALLLLFHTSAVASNEAAVSSQATVAQNIVDKATLTFNDFMRDPKYVWLHEHLNQAKGILIFPEVIQGGLGVGGSGGTGVLLVRDPSGKWGYPAFYTTASIHFGPLIGAEVKEVVMVAMTQKAIDSLRSSSFEMGGEVSAALGPVKTGEKMTVNIPNISADFVAFAKSRGLYAGLDLGGTDIKVRHNLNVAYYHAGVQPDDIIIKKDVSNRGATELLETLNKAG